MKERPILFSAPMVRALLNGAKTQTRRIASHPLFRPLTFIVDCGDGWWGDEEGDAQVRCPYGQPGDRLWVRETFFDTRPFGDAPLFSCRTTQFAFRASGEFIGCHQWKPSIHMPRVASRILLEIVSVSIERLQDISEADAIAEGVGGDVTVTPCFAVERYRALWESINGPGSWDANPWVWVVEFNQAQP